jgi:hypothetical protein
MLDIHKLYESTVFVEAKCRLHNNVYVIVSFYEWTQ